MKHRILWSVLAGSFFSLVAALAARGHDSGQQSVGARPRVFRIHVVEEGTGRGVPLVELKTVNQIRYVTDSNGIVAFDEPGLFNRKVFFTITSHGYEVENAFDGSWSSSMTGPERRQERKSWFAH